MMNLTRQGIGEIHCLAHSLRGGGCGNSTAPIASGVARGAASKVRWLHEPFVGRIVVPARAMPTLLSRRHWDLWLAILGAIGVWMPFIASPLNSHGSIALPWQTLGLLVIISPVLEEMLFRGVMQSWLRRRLSMGIGALTLANMLTSLAFAAAHLLMQQTVFAALTFFPSLMLGVLYDRRSSIPLCAAIHAYYNLGFALFVI